MNYIKHLNTIMERFHNDERLQPSHVSLYLALFRAWNHNRFQTPFIIDRFEVMQAAKIGSFTTYTRIIKDLYKWKYIGYKPHHNSSVGTKVELYSFCTTECTTESQNCTTYCTATPTKTVQLPYINIYKHNKHGDMASPHTQDEMDQEKKEASKQEKKESKKDRFQVPNLPEVLDFFRDRGQDEKEGQKFYNHFQSNGWKVGGKAPMKDWHAAAKNWILNARRFTSPKPPQSPHHTHHDKDYSEPL